MKNLLLVLVISLSSYSAHARSFWDSKFYRCHIKGYQMYLDKYNYWTFCRADQSGSDAPTIIMASDAVTIAVDTGDITPEEGKAVLKELNLEASPAQ